MAKRRYPPAENRGEIKHLLVYPGWLSPEGYRSYWKKRRTDACAEHLEREQTERRHRAFVENARTHGIPLPKKKKK